MAIGNERSLRDASTDDIANKIVCLRLLRLQTIDSLTAILIAAVVPKSYGLVGKCMKLDVFEALRSSYIFGDRKINVHLGIVGYVWPI